MTGGVAADVEAVAVERVFREAYGQVVATLTEKDRRFLTQQIEELAEDALLSRTAGSTPSSPR